MLLAVSAAMVVAGGLAGSSIKASNAASSSPPHIMVLMMENNSYSDIIGTTPYESQLAAHYQNGTQAYGLGHYSLDNYLGMASGNFYNWSTGDCGPGGSCLAPSSDQVFTSQMEAAGVSWQAFMGGMSTNCSSSDQNDYGVRHDPWPYFPSVSPSDCQAHVHPSGNSSNWDSDSSLIASLDSASAPDFVWYSPGLSQDGGGDAGCSASCGDSWLQGELPRIMATPWYQNGGQILLTYDEGNGGTQGEALTGSGNQVPSILISAATGAAPSTDSSYYNLWGVQAGIEKAYGLPCLGNACNTAANGLLSFGAAGSSSSGTSATTAPPSTTASTTAPPSTTAPTTAPPSTTAPTTAPPTTTAPSTGPTCNEASLPDGIAPDAGERWCLTMHDEFSQDSSLNTNLWEPNWLGPTDSSVTGPVNSNEQACYDPAEVSLSGGYLNLKSAASPCTVGGTTYPYRSGMVQTQGPGTTPLFQQAYGAFEARIYLPAQPAGAIANWPAFWTDGQPTWPNNGEMDIMEGLSGQACFHFHDPSGGPGSCVNGNFTGWHTYGADWQNGVVTYYYDGVKVGSISTGITSSPMYVVLNDAVGADGGQTLVPDDMQVAYVRVWSQQPTSGATTPTTAPATTAPTTSVTTATTAPATTVPAPTSTASPTTVAPAGGTASPLFDFENMSTDGWTLDYGPATVAPSTARAFTGDGSLAVTLTGAGNPGVVSPNPTSGIAAGQAVTYHVYVPASMGNLVVEPYASDSSYSYTFSAAQTLTAGTWNTVTFTPGGANVRYVGLEMENGAGATGTIYLDSVS